MVDSQRADSTRASRAPRRLATILFTLAAIPAALAQTTTAAQPAKAPKLEVSTTVWDFGEKWAGQKAETTITFRNVGDAPLTIDKVQSSCGCTVAKVSKKVFQPGESEEVKVTYNTDKRTEKVSQKVRVHSNDPDSPVTVIEIKGRVRQPLRLSEARGLNFGAIGRDDLVTKTIEIECTYTEPLNLKLKELRSTDFDVQLEELEAGKRYRLTATTKPPLRDGSIRANVQLLTGTELVPEIPVRIWGNVQAQVAVTPTTLYVVENTQKTSQRTLRVTSRRPQPLEVTGVTASNPAIKVEILPMPTMPAKAALASNAATIRVMLPPANEIPAAGATITINTNDEDYAQLVVPVKKRVLAKNPTGTAENVKDAPVAGSAKPNPPTTRKGTQP